MSVFQITEPVERRGRSLWTIGLMLWGVLICVSALQVYWLVTHHSTKDLVSTVISGSLLVWGATYLWQLAQRPIVNTVEVTPDGIRIQDSNIYDAFLPYSKIESITIRDTITFRDNIRDSFSWDGRSLLKGRQIAIRCKKLVRGGRFTMPVKVFRIKVDDMDRLVKLANGYKDRYRGRPE